MSRRASRLHHAAAHRVPNKLGFATDDETKPIRARRPCAWSTAFRAAETNRAKLPYERSPFNVVRFNATALFVPAERVAST